MRSQGTVRKDPKSKKPHEFHLKLRNKYIDDLDQRGVTICNSPYIRYLIYKELERRGLQYTTRVIGYGAVHGSSRSFSYDYTPKVAMDNLMRGRLSLEGVLTNYDSQKLYMGGETIGITRAEAESLFDPGVARDKKYEIISKASEKAQVYCPKVFIFHDACKTIKEIRCITHTPLRTF